MAIPMIAFRIENCQFLKDGGPKVMMIYQVTQGNPCHGCGNFNEGTCPSYRRLSQVPRDFDSQVMSINRNHLGLLSLTLALDAEHGIHFPGLGIALHLLTVEDPLQTPDAGKTWDGLKQKYPTNDKGIDCAKLAGDLRQKLQDLGLT